MDIDSFEVTILICDRDAFCHPCCTLPLLWTYVFKCRGVGRQQTFGGRGTGADVSSTDIPGSGKTSLQSVPAV